MTTIRIYDFVNGESATSYDEGIRCLQAILPIIDTDDVELDFNGVNFVITAFLNPVIGDLILETGNEVMKKIRIVNANDNIIQKIKMVKEGTLLKREDMDG